jgi:hypothetical protein
MSEFDNNSKSLLHLMETILNSQEGNFSFIFSQLNIDSKITGSTIITPDCCPEGMKHLFNNYYNITLLHIAAYYGNQKIVSLLANKDNVLALAIPVYDKTNNNNFLSEEDLIFYFSLKPRHYALMGKHDDLFACLLRLENGSDFN